MAKPEDLAVLRNGVEIWNQWRKSNPDLEPDLTGSQLRGLDLRYSDFYRVNFSGANLSEADLSRASFRAATVLHAQFTKAVLSGADLMHADFSGTDLSGAGLINAAFVNVKVEQTRYEGCRAWWTIFGNLDLSQTMGLERVQHLGPSVVGVDTIVRSKGMIPETFLRGAGTPDNFISFSKSLVSRAPQFFSCFISYSHTDRPFARRLHDGLQARGIRCWLDEKQLLPGHDIYEEVDRGIRLWDKFLLCCSQHSLKPSSWVDKEIISVLEKEDELTRQRGQKVHALIPLNLDGYLFTEEWKSGYRTQIRRRLAADFSGWQTDVAKFDEQLDNVIRALRADDDASERPPHARL
jgi:hypothetical protein